MTYIDVIWLHDADEFPYRLVSEIGKDRFERRKLEFFRDGVVHYATETSQSGKAMLGSVEVPDIEDITRQDEFDGKEIDKEEFEQLWSRYGPA